MVERTGVIDLVPIDHPLADGTGPAWAAEWGDDDEFGPFAILEVPCDEKLVADARPSGCPMVRQRWRYIPPGEFLMGSPVDEAGRYEQEGPQHRVRLTQGFWIADTPCTQGLWKAVMGTNPSRFVDDERPVEQVSWLETQEFLTRLNERIPMLRAALPTEAQWEYACRAGSTTPIHATQSGSTPWRIEGERNAPALDPIAWYGGNSGLDFELSEGEDSSSWPQKQFPHRKAGTHRVGLKLPNPWGLYDMLGNVWEWCADGMRVYADIPVSDPLGPMDIGSRCVRGGGWSSHARHVRCACRNQDASEYRLEDLGFRLVRVQDGS
jgi:formylglycine-generating enzyme required for sulfatase activity